MRLLKLSMLAFLVMAVAAGCNSGTTTTEEKPDGSTVEASTAPDGAKTEVRTFKTGEVARVTRTTSSSGRSKATVEFRDGRKADIQDENDVKQVMDASVDALVFAAGKVWDGTKWVTAQTVDKAEDVGEAVADKAEDVGEAIGKGAKKAGKKVKDAINP